MLAVQRLAKDIGYVRGGMEANAEFKLGQVREPL
jgi:hypothetical protein